MSRYIVTSVDPDICLRLGQIVIKWSLAKSLISATVATLISADIGAFSALSQFICGVSQTQFIRSSASAEMKMLHIGAEIEASLQIFDILENEYEELVRGLWNSDMCKAGTCVVSTNNLKRPEITKDRTVSVLDLENFSNEIEEWLTDFVSLAERSGFLRNKGDGEPVFGE